MYKGVGVRFGDFIYFFLIETKLFIFIEYVKMRDREGVQANPLNPL